MSNLPTKNTSLNIGITKPFSCSYLPDQEEQLLMLIEPKINAQHFYPTLLKNGFRRNGDQVYLPQCPQCQACQSLRIHVKTFKKSRSQKRLLNKNKKFNVVVSQSLKPQYFALYKKYINQIHFDGPMYPASKKQYDDFINSSWNKALFIEIYDQDKLISVSITDEIKGADSAWSAFYCFYDPDYSAHSLGKYAVLSQLKLAERFNIDWLYLGYYIEKCQKMNYKTQFNPHQRFINRKWLDFNTTIKASFI